jgi:uncharacterized membrane protein YkoI
MSCLIVAVIFISWIKLTGAQNASAELLSEKEAKTLVQDRYQGTVTSIKQSNNQFQIELEKQNNKYHITLDAVSGKILSFTKTSTKTATPTPPNQPPAVVKNKLTEAEARKIAEKQVNGVVDHLFLETKSDVTYYLVELKTPDNQEAVVQIHAYTGNVMSVTWDDNHRNGKDSTADKKKERGKEED